MAARVIHENPAHHLRGDAEEMSPIPPIDVPLVNQPKVDLVDQCRRLKRVANTFGAKLTRSDSTQLRINERKQLVQRVGITVPPLRQ